ncbi:MAG: hypothetical protein K8S99_17045 [Planctomycetes bacterium]|nr:hypothetical protein [Planctomycetota bacterium]
MTHAQSTAYRCRWALLILGLLAITPGLVWVLWPELKWFGVDSVGVMGTPVIWGAMIAEAMGYPGGFNGEGFLNACAGAFLVGLVLLAQWMFLRPRRDLAIRLAKTARPMWTSIITAAFMAMMLTTGLIATLLTLPGWWEEVVQDKNNLYYTWLVMLLLWSFWAVLFFIYWRGGDRYTQLSRMVRRLLAGSILEMIIAAPVQAYSDRPNDCYCAKGSYTGLILGGTVAVWAFGPGIVLLFLREKYRRAKLNTVECTACGYDLSGSLRAGKTECPECGAKVAEKDLRTNV